MTLQELTEQWRKKAPPAFARPDAYTAAIYASTEIHEALDAANRRRRAGDLRSRADSEKDRLERELGQSAFMICSIATELGLELTEYDVVLHESDNLIELLFLAGIEINRIGIHIGRHERWQRPLVLPYATINLTFALKCIRKVAAMLDVDLESEINLWMEEVQRKAASESGFWQSLKKKISASWMAVTARAL